MCKAYMYMHRCTESLPFTPDVLLSNSKPQIVLNNTLHNVFFLTHTDTHTFIVHMCRVLERKAYIVAAHELYTMMGSYL